MTLTRAVIAAAGLGTRLLPATKEQPKEMLPIFAMANGRLCLKPIVQLVFEQLYDAGYREFCFVIGRGKRAIEDHFSQDYTFLSELERDRKETFAEDLRSFYRRLDDSTIFWITQPKPSGFGDAVKRARSAMANDDFLVHAGDTYILSRNNEHLKRLYSVFAKFNAKVALLLKRMPDPQGRGVVDAQRIGEAYLVKRAVEKPTKYFSDMAIEPVYMFKPCIFDALNRIGPGAEGEIQLTDAIQLLVSEGSEVYATELDVDDVRLDVGNPESYWEALQLSGSHMMHGDCVSV